MNNDLKWTTAACITLLTITLCVVVLFVGISKAISSYSNDIGYKRENLNGVYCIIEVGKDTNVYCPVNPTVKIN